MRNDQKDTPFLKTKFGLFLSLLVTAVLIFGIVGFVKKLNVANKNKKQEEAKLNFYQSEREKIEARLVDVNSEDGIDQSVRQNFNLAKEGEGLVVIVEEPVTEEEMWTQKERGSFLDFLKRLFSKK